MVGTVEEFRSHQARKVGKHEINSALKASSNSYIFAVFFNFDCRNFADESGEIPAFLKTKSNSGRL